MLRSTSLFVVFVLAGAATSVQAARPRANPAALQKVLDCRQLIDDKARLACFDSSTTELDAASARGDVAVVDREQVKETRRKLFGFTLPSLAIFNGNDDGDDDRSADDKEGVAQITGTIRAVSRNANGGWIITLEDGARWEQTGAMTFGRSPKPGAIATIKRAALGSFKMSIAGSPFVKARRIG